MILHCEQCGSEGEFETIVGGLCPECREVPTDNISKKDIKPRSKTQKVIYISFRVLGLIAIYSGYLISSELSASGGATGGLPGVLGILVLVPFGIPLLLAAILGPGLSLFVGWNDRCLMSLNGLSILFVILLGVVEAGALAPLCLAYGIACMTIGAKWIAKMNEKTQRPDVKPTGGKVSCPRCYAFVPGDQPNCTSCGKPLR